jgi:hypothetical protein
MSDHKSDLLEVDTGKEKWNAQQLGVNSDIPLKDDGTGQKYIIRQFLFSFDPEKLQKMRDNKMRIPTDQELFNSNWPQIRTMLWGDGLIAVEEKEYPPKLVRGKGMYKIILTCQPKLGVMVADKMNKLQDVLKPKRLTSKK